MMTKKREYRTLMGILGLLFLLAVAGDAWEIYAHGVNLNQHIPGLFEFIIAFWGVAVWVVYKKAGTMTVEQRAKLAKTTWDNSCLNPQNTTRGGGIE